MNIFLKITLKGFSCQNEALVKFNKTITEGHAMEAFTLSLGLSQLVSKNLFSQSSSQLSHHLFLTADPQQYTIEVPSPLVNSYLTMTVINYPTNLEKT